jgi:hypothetical protein
MTPNAVAKGKRSLIVRLPPSPYGCGLAPSAARDFCDTRELAARGKRVEVGEVAFEVSHEPSGAPVLPQAGQRTRARAALFAHRSAMCMYSPRLTHSHWRYGGLSGTLPKTAQ